MTVTSFQISGCSKQAINVTLDISKSGLDFLCYSSSISFERIAQFHCNAKTLTGLTKPAATNSKQEKLSSGPKNVLWLLANTSQPACCCGKKACFCMDTVAVHFLCSLFLRYQQTFQVTVKDYWESNEIR